MSAHDSFDDGTFDIRRYENPNPESLPKARRADYIKRRDAQLAVLNGASVRSAAKEFNVARQTLRDIGIKFIMPGPDGRPLGFRACIPWGSRREASARGTDSSPPASKAPGAFTKVIMATPGSQDLIDSYSAPLPSGKSRNAKFDALHKKLTSAIRKQHGSNVYPFDTPDHGRRALLEYIKRQRRQRKAAHASEVGESKPDVRRLSQIFQLRPLDRIEYDGHTIDVDWRMSIPTPDGGMVIRTIRQVTLLAAICAVSRYVLGYVLKFGAYSQLDILQLFHDILLPWQPRQLVVPSMVYAPGAVLGLPAACDGRALRGSLLAKDNAYAHHAEAAKGNLLLHHRGVLNFGPAHVPEVRPIIEAFFRRIEQGALRGVAGAFHPATSMTADRVAATPFSSEEHPIHWEAFRDLMDVAASGHNVTPHSGINERLPVDAVRAHVASGAWTFETAEPQTDARQLLTLRIHPTVRGSKLAGGKLPYIEWNGAIYRSPVLDAARERVGKKQIADVYLGDVRHMMLLSPDGTVWSKLLALPPWDRTPHTLDQRKKINAVRNRGLIRIAGAEDALAAYHEFVHDQALAGHGSVELYAQSAISLGQRCVQQSESPRAKRNVTPRSGAFSFDGRKD